MDDQEQRQPAPAPAPPPPDPPLRPASPLADMAPVNLEEYQGPPANEPNLMQFNDPVRIETKSDTGGSQDGA